VIILSGSLINQQAGLISALWHELLLKYCKGRKSIHSRLVGALDDVLFSLSEKKQMTLCLPFFLKVPQP